MAIIRVYADTSVFGGVFDDEFEAPSRTFFDQVRSGRFQLVTSALVQEEIDPAPVQVQELFNQILPVVEVIEVSEKTLRLRDAYLEAGIVSSQWSEDALHVALATVSGCSLIVSWNFKHIVHFEKIPLYNAVNVLNGYSNVGIFSPLEVIQL
jgi:predicted nucleic acid-binding protein